MDETKVREHAEKHAEAVQRGDLQTAGADLTKEAAAQAGSVMREVPRTVDAVEIVDVTSASEGVVARIRYAGTDKEGNSKEATVDSVWIDVDGTPRIAELRVV